MFDALGDRCHPIFPRHRDEHLDQSPRPTILGNAIDEYLVDLQAGRAQALDRRQTVMSRTCIVDRHAYANCLKLGRNCLCFFTTVDFLTLSQLDDQLLSRQTNLVGKISQRIDESIGEKLLGRDIECELEGWPFGNFTAEFCARLTQKRIRHCAHVAAKLRQRNEPSW